MTLIETLMRWADKRADDQALIVVDVLIEGTWISGEIITAPHYTKLTGLAFSDPENYLYLTNACSGTLTDRLLALPWRLVHAVALQKHGQPIGDGFKDD